MLGFHGGLFFIGSCTSASRTTEAATEAAVVALSCGRGLAARAFDLDAGPKRAVRANGEFFSFGLTPRACSRIFMFICCSADVPGRAVLSPTSCLLLSAVTSLLLFPGGALFRGVLSEAALERRCLAWVILPDSSPLASLPADGHMARCKFTRENRSASHREDVDKLDLAVDSRLDSFRTRSCEDSFIIGCETERRVSRVLCGARSR